MGKPKSRKGILVPSRVGGVVENNEEAI